MIRWREKDSGIWKPWWRTLWPHGARLLGKPKLNKRSLSLIIIAIIIIMIIIIITIIIITLVGGK